MRVTTGRVEGGKIVVLEDSPLEEGIEVIIVAPEGEETFELNETDAMELLAAIQEADRGDVVSSDEVLRNLRTKSD